jgi:hypothetical protein
MNEKLIKFARSEGYCCMWAFLEAHRETYTNELVKLAKEAGFELTARAIRHQRRAYRRKQIQCKQNDKCLKVRLQEARKNV